MGTTSPIGLPYPDPGDPLASWRAKFQEAMEAVDDYLEALSAVAAVAWTDVTLSSGWSHLGTAGALPGSPTEKSQYARRAGVVTIALAQTKATSVAALATICTIPSGFRPSRPVRSMGEFNGNQRPVIVMPSGDVLAGSAWSSNIGVVGTFTFAV